MANEHYKITPTAILCANARSQFTDMPYAKEIYEEMKKEGIDSDKILSRFIVKLAFLFPKVRDMVSLLEGRYYSTNEAMKQLGNHSVLELATGLSSRGLEQSPNVPIYIESDLPGIIENKKKIVESIRRNQSEKVLPNHRFLELNVLDQESLRKAGEIYKQAEPNLPLAIIHEGLFCYLSRDEQIQVRDNIANLLREYSPDGAWISIDFSSRKVKEDPIISWIKRRIRKQTERQFTYFDSDDEVFNFLDQGGLVGRIVKNNYLVDDLSCVSKLNLNPEKVRDLANRYRPYFIQLRK
jgi:O-methyltransferase involved in polyketide biosynthesis